MIKTIGFIFISLCFGQDTLSGAGATFPYPIYSLWARKYSEYNMIKFNYEKSGSGNGIKAIKARKVTLGATDAPLNSRELKKHHLVQFPMIIGAVVPIYNLPNKQQLTLSGELLALIFEMKVTVWNDMRIALLNPEITLPADSIITYGRSDKSGTTAIFTSYLSQVSSNFNKTIGSGKHVNWPVNHERKGNFSISQAVKNTPFSISYTQFDYASKMKLSIPQLLNKTGTIVEASQKSFNSATQSGSWSEKTDFETMLVNSDGKFSWPIMGASFLLLAKETNPQVALDYIHWSFKYGDKLAETLFYVPLPNGLKTMVLNYLHKHFPSWKTDNVHSLETR